MAPDVSLKDLLQELAENRGFDFRGYKRTTLERRFRKRMFQLNIGSYAEYSKYIRQIGINLSEAYIQQSLANNPNIARLLIQLFQQHFDPQLGPAGKMSGRHFSAMNIRAQIEDALNSVSNPDEDRILWLYVTLIEATQRTNYY